MTEPRTEAGKRLILQFEEQARLSPGSRTLRQHVLSELRNGILAIEAEAAASVPRSPEPCDAPAIGGRCVLPRGHNMGNADVPENHHAAPPPQRSSRP
jgi:hypothetical protein